MQAAPSAALLFRIWYYTAASSYSLLAPSPPDAMISGLELQDISACPHLRYARIQHLWAKCSAWQRSHAGNHVRSSMHALA